MESKHTISFVADHGYSNLKSDGLYSSDSYPESGLHIYEITFSGLTRDIISESLKSLLRELWDDGCEENIYPVLEETFYYLPDDYPLFDEIDMNWTVSKLLTNQFVWRQYGKYYFSALALDHAMFHVFSDRNAPTYANMDLIDWGNDRVGQIGGIVDLTEI